ncbi:hypothetical protein CRUP_028467, partial [Coryphaenoides rupestris]
VLSDLLDEGYPAPKGIQVQVAQLERSEHQGVLALDPQDPQGCLDRQEEPDPREPVYLDKRGHSVEQEPRAPKEYLVKASKDPRGRLDTEEPQDPEALQVLVYRGRRASEGSTVNTGERVTRESLESQGPWDPGAERDRRVNQDLRAEVITIVKSICSCGVTCREIPLELVFVIDSSESVGPENFDVVKDFVNALVDRASVGPGTTRVGVVLYSHFNTVVLGLGHDASSDQVKSAVRAMTYMGEGTFTGSAIQRATRVFLAARRGVRKVAIVITDGQADDRDAVSLEGAVKEAHGSDIEMFVVGVVNRSDALYEQFKKELHLMASDPDEEHVYLIKDFDMLTTLEQKLLSKICENPDTRLFSHIPSSRTSPGTADVAGNVQEPPYRTDTPTFTGDARRTQMVPGPPAPRPHADPLVPHTPRPSGPLDTGGHSSGPQATRPPTGPVVEPPTQDRPTLPPRSALLDKASCGESLDPGTCRDYLVRWYYDPAANACAKFWYGGCHGNNNRFETEQICRNTCVV